jgi:hypothetical protein
MRLPNKIVCGFLFLFCLTTLKMQAQPTNKDSLIADSAYASALRLYHTFMDPEPGLYRGNRYVDYDYRIQEGQPFFGPDSIRMGTVVYDGIFFDHVPLLYDLVLGSLITNDPYRAYKISLIMDLVDSFTITDHIFFRLLDSLNPSAPRNGFYERLYQGHILLLKKEKKNYVDNVVVSVDNIQNYIGHTVSYYLKKGGTYYLVNTKKALLNTLKDRKNELRKFIRRNNLSWHDDKENLLLKVIPWYDGLNP